MNYKQLKKEVQSIEMSNEMKSRIITNCNLKKESENFNMRKHPLFKKPLFFVGLLSLCTCFTVSAITYFGSFKDIKNFTGAIISTAYEQATNEIDVHIETENNTIIVYTTLLYPNKAPYSEIETLGIKEYKIVDSNNNVIDESKLTNAYEIINGKVTISIPLHNTNSSSYKLIINSFIGYKKADQPLPIMGNWELTFTI